MQMQWGWRGGGASQATEAAAHPAINRAVTVTADMQVQQVHVQHHCCHAPMLATHHMPSLHTACLPACHRHLPSRDAVQLQGLEGRTTSGAPWLLPCLYLACTVSTCHRMQTPRCVRSGTMYVRAHLMRCTCAKHLRRTRERGATIAVPALPSALFPRRAPPLVRSRHQVSAMRNSPPAGRGAAAEGRL
jgi:hypothetical protein